MPLIKKIIIEGGLIGVWEMTETPEDFSQLFLNDEDSIKLNQYSFDKRKVEFLSIRCLLKELTGYNHSIKYHPDGRPFLVGSQQQISISHSKNLVTIILNSSSVGIDVEIEGREVNKILKKFLSEIEINNIIHSNNIERAQLLYWCAKEAIFKLTPHQGIDFKSQIEITPFEIFDSGEFNANLIIEKNISPLRLKYQFLKGNALVWCVGKD